MPRRAFLKDTFLGALGAKHVTGMAIGGAAVAAGGAYGAKLAQGKVLEDLPIEVRDDYRPYDQRDMVFSMVASTSCTSCRSPSGGVAWKGRELLWLWPRNSQLSSMASSMI